MSETRRQSGWTVFWNRGGFGRALLLAAVYVALYLLAGWVIGSIFSDRVDSDDVVSSAGSVFFGLAAPIIVAAVLLLLFVRSVGWWREIFGPQPIRGRGWMWIAPIVVVGFDVLRFAATDYTAFTTSTVVTLLFLGLCVGFVEELVTRGLVVNLLRRAGYKEWAVMMLSSLVFALLHTVNVLSGIDAKSVASIVVYTFAFGVTMYLTLRVTGNILWPMLVHAATDPSGILLSGGLDVSKSASDADALATFAGLGNVFVILAGVVLLFFVRGKVGREAYAGAV